MSQAVRFEAHTSEEDGERAVIILAEHHAYHRGATDGRHGPPIEPDEPEHWEIESVTFADTGAAVPPELFSDDDAYDVINEDCRKGRFDPDPPDRDDY